MSIIIQMEIVGRNDHTPDEEEEIIMYVAQVLGVDEDDIAYDFEDTEEEE